MLLLSQPTSDRDQTEAYQRFARRRARGDVLFPPYLLPKEERRRHVRETLREDHRFRVQNHPEDAQAKFDKIASSPFKFFRGTALLYYRDQAGTDADLPTVLTVGDVHPENFGVMPNEDGAPFFGIDDYDEAHFAPFSWDVKRGAVGFDLACRELGLKKKKRRRTVKAFVRGYLDGLVEFARSDREKWHEFRIDNSPPLIRDLLEQASTRRREFLAELIDLETGRFIATDEIVPHSAHTEEFQTAMDEYRERSNVPEGGRAGHFHVKDVAIKKGSGTASMGLERYFVLIDGPTGDHADDIILEVKQTRRSALYGLTPARESASPEEAERVVQASQIHLVGGDPYYGHTTLDGKSFLVRERSPFKDDIDLDDLDFDQLREYAGICGKVLAQCHARSDADTGIMEGEAERTILESVDVNLFVEDVTRFAAHAAKRVLADYRLFCKDHALGAFHFVDE